MFDSCEQQCILFVCVYLLIFCTNSIVTRRGMIINYNIKLNIKIITVDIEANYETLHSNNN